MASFGGLVGPAAIAPGACAGFTIDLTGVVVVLACSAGALLVAQLLGRRRRRPALGAPRIVMPERHGPIAA